MHTFSPPWNIVRYLRCTRLGQNGRRHRMSTVGSRLLIPRNYRILEKASNERAGFAKGIRIVRGGGGQKSRVNPCKSKLSPASSCTAPRIISFSLRIQLISALLPIPAETLQNLTVSNLFLPFPFRYTRCTFDDISPRVLSRASFRHNFSPSGRKICVSKFPFTEGIR